MTSIPLFRQVDLHQAFRLILPDALASATAQEWWSMFADDIDSNGYYLYQDPILGGMVPKGPQVVAVGRHLSEAQRLENERRFWGGMSQTDRRELLLRFSSFHLGLLALVSPELRERIRNAQGWTQAQMEHDQEQMARIVAALSPLSPP